jgi:hypothetical protein
LLVGDREFVFDQGRELLSRQLAEADEPFDAGKAIDAD